MMDDDRSWRRFWRRVLLLVVAMIAGIAAVASLIGFLVAGTPGVLGALVGAALTAVFMGITALVMFLGRTWSVTTLALGLGIGFAAKVLVFMLTVPRLAQLPEIHGPTAFFTIVAAIIGSTALEAWLYQRARITSVDPGAA